jgi:hypothetical protein
MEFGGVMWRMLLVFPIFLGLALPTRADFDNGLMALTEEHYKVALEEFRAGARDGHAASQYNLGLMLHRGLGVKRNYAEALRLYRFAARQGHSLAANNIGIMYRLGGIVNQDHAEAVRWFEKAAKKEAVGKNNLASMYLTGRGVDTDYARAYRLFRAAAAMPPRLFKKPRKCPPYCILPHEAAPGVATVSELEVLRFLEEGRGIAVDTRIVGLFRLGTIPGAVNIARKGATKRLGEFGCTRNGDAWDCSTAKPALLFCDGALGDEAPKAIRDMVDAGFPADRLFYYRGGLQSWTLLGLTMVKPR